MKIGEHVEAMTFAQRFCEPAQAHLRLSDRATSDVWVARRTRIDRESEFSPGIHCSLVSPIIDIQESPSCQRAHVGPAEAFEQLHASVEISISGGLCANEHQL